MGRRTWRQIPGRGMVEITPTSRIPQDDMRFDSPFISPVDGSLINSKRDLHEHNRRNNVEQTSDGHMQDWQSRGKEREDFLAGRTGKEERIEAIRETLYRLGERP